MNKRAILNTHSFSTIAVIRPAPRPPDLVKSCKFSAQRRGFALWLTLSLIVFAPSIVFSAGPIYKTQRAIGEPADNYTLTGFNNEGDILGAEGVRGESFIYHHGVYEVLPQQGAPEITSSVPTAMNNADANGVVRIIGTAWVNVTNAYGGIYKRGACWLVPSNSAFAITEESMPNYIYPDSNNYMSHPGESFSGTAVAVNDSGVVVGSGFWQPNGYGYGNSQWGVYNNQPVESVDGIDDFGNYFVNYWQWDYGLPTARLNTLIGPSFGELPGVDTTSGTNAYSRMIHGGFVVGEYLASDPRLIGTLENGVVNRAFAWKVGDANLTQLPDPVVAGFSGASIYSVAESVNNAGDAVGVVEFWNGSIVNGTAGGNTFVVLWKRNASGGYTAYNLSDLVPDQYVGPNDDIGGQDNPPLINDNGEIALETREYSFSPIYITVLAPTGGAITVSGTQLADQYTSAYAVLSLQRADGYNGPVTVQYGTSDGSAIGNIRYVPVQGTITWTNGDSSDKYVYIPLIPVHTGVPAQDFNFTLSNPTNATFGGYGAGSNLDIYVSDDGGLFSFFYTNSSAIEYWTNVTMGLERSFGSDGAATVAFQTADGTAIAGKDYMATNGTITWASGDDSIKRFSIPIINRGGNAQNASFTINAYLQSADSGAAAMAPGGGLATITITRPGHPVAPTIKNITATRSGFTLDIEGTQGGAFLTQIADNMAFENSQFINAFTNVFGVGITNLESPTNVLNFIRLMAQ